MGNSTSLKDRAEAYFMHANEITLKEGRKWLDVDKVGDDLGLPAHEARILAQLLIDRGWLMEHPIPLEGAPKVRITMEGLYALDKLREPWISRWAEKHPRMLALLGWTIGVASTVTGAILIEYLKRTFWPPTP